MAVVDAWMDLAIDYMMSIVMLMMYQQFMTL